MTFKLRLRERILGWLVWPRFMWRMRRMKKHLKRETALGYMQIGGKGTADEQLETVAFFFTLIRMGNDKKLQETK